MMGSTRQGVSLQTKKEEKEAVIDEDEEKFWSAGLFVSGTAKQLLDTIYFYNGKIFGLRGGEHRKTCVTNFSLGPNVELYFAELCKAAGIKRKPVHCFRVTCVCKLFNRGVEEKLIRERTGHRSNALFVHGKTSEKKSFSCISFIRGRNEDRK